MNSAERRVLAAVTQVARGRLTKAGHAAIVVQTESRGYCHWRKPCGPTCTSVNAAIREAEALLAASEPVPIRQLALAVEGEAAG